ncbi:DUF1365 domain-containing protein [Insolitispirillum peregrinum]|uniref:DUF1365 domain-containing protein n=1 Tax=Insolitispirillum peregrinum TaxID=80876 RepID=UPI0036099271
MMSEPLRSGAYVGSVMHQRHQPTAHRLQYRVFSLYLDIDELGQLDRTLRWFSFNRFNLFSLFDRDHGAADGSALRPWVEEQLNRAGISATGGRIGMLCYPRLFGFVFNPLTVFFCHDADDRLTAVLYEVRNTFGQRHTYLLPVSDPASSVVRHGCDKRFYVSPFISMDAHYDFRILVPGEKTILAIHETNAGGALLDARFIGHRRELTDRTLIRLLLTHPLMTLKVVAGIHWEALKLWRKGMPFFSRPSPPPEAVTIVPPSPQP